MTVLSIEGPDRRGLTSISFNKPERSNALNAEFVEVLIDALADASSNGTRVLVLRGAGRNFCSGFDLFGKEKETDATLALRFIRIEQMLQLLVTSPFLTVACTHGAAFGAGADIVASCDQRLALPGSRFCFPGYRFGVALGTRRLAAITGAAAAQEILSSSRVLSSEEALSYRLLTAVLHPESMAMEIDRLATNFTKFDASATVTLVTQTRQPAADLDADLAMLARSVAVPGLKARLSAYAAQARAATRSS